MSGIFRWGIKHINEKTARSLGRFQRFDETQQLFALLKPNHGTGGGLNIPYRPTLIDDDGGSALDEDHCFFQSVQVINLAFWVCQDRER